MKCLFYIINRNFYKIVKHYEVMLSEKIEKFNKIIKTEVSKWKLPLISTIENTHISLIIIHNFFSLLLEFF